MLGNAVSCHRTHPIALEKVIDDIDDKEFQVV